MYGAKPIQKCLNCRLHTTIVKYQERISNKLDMTRVMTLRGGCRVFSTGIRSFKNAPNVTGMGMKCTSSLRTKLNIQENEVWKTDDRHGKKKKTIKKETEDF